MANLSINEYGNLGHDLQGSILPAGLEPAAVIQNIAFTKTLSAQSSAFHSDTRFVRLVSDVNVRLKFSYNPTADQNDSLMVAGQTEFFAVRPTMKVSVIQVA
ncbi:MAG: hypothetical protein KZQ66_21290 [Candidatus Thiodiazotropha sp. (ex Lucinoma aequizonata)]|nr:hypothetical protein [Candidatus Thiodiazotropha sp. (ex Lucinoma aequizonata)]MCU7895081.1 hypothetical protein [Candidatus Thiodiazotropha sp. (ex Lucinoma aequizonata)]MCU7904197.1 hypothetical protein [Candidatus Thiodiazotropha sp. (ex Lucinoma aequizonata)]MCU7912160.1 hypothetical protein [Candidatus Thiodiazotropha sp. (ex Lucinoma aequizonata)]